IALADLDRVAVVAFADRIVADFPLTRGKARILSLMRFLENLSLQGSDTNLAETATAFVHRPQRRGLAIVISDLFDPSGFQRGLDRLRYHQYEPSVVQIYDRRDAEPDVLGDVELFDIETQVGNKITVTEKNLKQYRRVFAEFLQSVRNYCRNHAISCTTTTTDVSFDELILGMMRASRVVG
ncbi:MAG: VWA domain-containing protein, partial [Planctomycetes bacterium]|nr:VWA domain-containing protein [Planctomycetota bacterium]